VDEEQAGRPVGAGVDGSDPSLRAVRWAAREAGRRRAPLRMVQAIGCAPPLIQSSDTRAHRVRELQLGAAGEQLQAVKRAAAQDPQFRPGTLPGTDGPSGNKLAVRGCHQTA